MATISYIQEHNQSAAAMKAVIDYCGQEKKVFDKLSSRRLVSGVNCDGENAYKEFMATKKDTDSEGNGRVYESSGEHRHEILYEDGERLSRRADSSQEGYLDQTGTDGEEYQSHTIKDRGEYQTGWEESRELFEQHLAEREQAGTVYSGSGEEGRYTVRGEVDSNFDSVLGGIDSLASSVSKIIDDSSEDPEERRKRIEAEENAEAIGTILGTAIGLTAEAISSAKARREQQAEEEQQRYYEEECNDYDEDEDIGFGLSM